MTGGLNAACSCPGKTLSPIPGACTSLAHTWHTFSTTPLRKCPWVPATSFHSCKQVGLPFLFGLLLNKQQNLFTEGIMKGKESRGKIKADNSVFSLLSPPRLCLPISIPPPPFCFAFHAKAEDCNFKTELAFPEP